MVMMLRLSGAVKYMVKIVSVLTLVVCLVGGMDGGSSNVGGDSGHGYRCRVCDAGADQIAGDKRPCPPCGNAFAVSWTGVRQSDPRGFVHSTS